MTGLDVIDYLGRKLEPSLCEEILGFDLFAVPPQYLEIPYKPDLAMQLYRQTGTWPVSAGLK